MEKQAEALKTLLAGSLDYLMPLVRTRMPKSLVKRNGILIVYRSERGWQSDERAWNIRRRAGIIWHDLDTDEFRQFDPSLVARSDPRQARSRKRPYRRSRQPGCRPGVGV